MCAYLQHYLRIVFQLRAKTILTQSLVSAIEYCVKSRPVQSSLCAKTIALHECFQFVSLVVKTLEWEWHIRWTLKGLLSPLQWMLRGSKALSFSSRTSKFCAMKTEALEEGG